MKLKVIWPEGVILIWAYRWSEERRHHATGMITRRSECRHIIMSYLSRSNHLARATSCGASVDISNITFAIAGKRWRCGIEERLLRSLAKYISWALGGRVAGTLKIRCSLLATVIMVNYLSYEGKFTRRRVPGDLHVPYRRNRTR